MILSIDVLELQAALFALQSLCKNDANIHNQLQLDNTTAVAYIYSMGDSKYPPPCNQIAKKIWLWAIECNIWLSATHLPGAQNIIADDKSRNFSDNIEWVLDPTVFHTITTYFGMPSIDLFASRLTAQTSSYAAWQPDSNARFIDALSFY